MELKEESKTLFIPLYGKALMSKECLFLKDKKAEEIINKVDYNFKKLKQSKWLSMYMALRAKKIDEICKNYIDKDLNLIVIHFGCGLDSRNLRIGQNVNWYDIDLKNVIDLRKEYYIESDKYKMIGKSVTDLTWLDDIEYTNQNVLVIAEGLTMYLLEEEIIHILEGMKNKFTNLNIVFDAYSKKAVKVSKYKNPVNQMNATIKWGIDSKDEFLKLNKNLEFINEYKIEGKEEKLKGITKFIFEKLYCGKTSEKLYKIYEFKL